MNVSFSQTVSFFLSFLVVALIIFASSPVYARSFIISNISQDSQTFLIVNGSTGYTGINMGNPLYPLDIAGSLRWSGNLTGGAVPWARLAEFPDSCPAGEAIQSIGGTITCIKLNSTSGNASGSGTINYTAKFLSENVIGDSIIYDNGINVGIGTANPQNKLNVIGSINATGNVYGMAGLCIGTDCKAAWSEVASPWDNSSTQLFVRAGYPLLINASNTLFVDGASGKAGIGTANPVKTFDVVGDINATIGIYGVAIYQNGNAVLDNTSVISTYNSSYDAFMAANYSAKTDYVNNATERELFLSTYNTSYIQIGGHLGGIVTSPTVINTAGLSWGNITSGWDLNKAWTGSLGWGNISGFSLIGNNITVSNIGGVYTLTYNVSDSVDSAKIVDGSVTAADLASDLSSLNKVSAGEMAAASGMVTIENDLKVMKNLYIIGNISNVDVTTINVNGSAIPYFPDTFNIGSLSNAWKYGYFGTDVLVDGNSVLHNATVFSGNMTGSYNSLNLLAESVDSAKIVDGSIAAADIANGAITSANLVSDLGLEWGNLTGYPNNCAAGEAIQSLGDGSFTCVALNSTSGNISGAGNQNYVSKFITSDKIGNSIIYDDGTNVGIGTTSSNAKLEVAGGMRLNTTDAKPTCDAAQRGTFWLEQSSGGVDDYLYACMRNSTSDFNWVLVARAG